MTVYIYMFVLAQYYQIPRGGRVCQPVLSCVSALHYTLRECASL